MYPYAIGLDIGTTSVGWAAIALNGDELPIGILDFGSRIFQGAEHPKTGASLAAPRREARGARRRLRRHRHRIERIKQLIIAHGILDEQQLGSLFDGKIEDIYLLRVRALDEKISNLDLARIMINLAQRRGFRSNRAGGASSDDGRILEAVNENTRRMELYGYRTVGEMFLNDPAYREHKRNKNGQYLSTVTRSMVESEARMIFAAQRSFGSVYAAQATEDTYLNILLGQRSFDEGPGGNSPYSGSQIERMIGKCTFEADEPRAAKASYSFEYFTLLSKLNNIRLISAGKTISLSESQRRKLIALSHKTDTLTFAKIRKELALDDSILFSSIHYQKDKTPEETEKKEKIPSLKAYHQIRRAIDSSAKGRFLLLTLEQRNEIGRVLSCYKTHERVAKELESIGIEPCDIATLESLSFRGFGHLSVKACSKLIPYLEKGLTYSDACTAAGYDFRAHSKDGRQKYLPPLSDDCNEITSPVVRRAVSQTIKVINAIIRRYGDSPVYVNIELARELSKDFSERNRIQKQFEENRSRNAALMEQIREYTHATPSGMDLVKFKLFNEQGGTCAYSLRQMSLERLFEPNYAEVDHIVPYSISFDDSYRNKVLVLTEENRNKGNRLPLEYLKGERRDKFIVWANANVRDYNKRNLLLKEHLSDEEKQRWKERGLQDTKTVSSFMLNYINDNLSFAPSSRRKKRVTAVNGAVTGYMRKRWGISKLREDGDRHHAVDALIVACTTDAMIQKVSRYESWHESRYMPTENGSILIDPLTGEVLQEFPLPWPCFRKELDARLTENPDKHIAKLRLPFYMGEYSPSAKPLFVSRMPNRKVTGAAHKDTVKSVRAIDEGITIVKRPLTALSLDKSGEIAGYYKPESDTLLYDALKKRLEAFGGNGKKAFEAPFFKPKKDGSPGPLVNKVKICEPSTLSVPVHNGLGTADNNTMVRIDIFKVEGDGYYMVPIYVADTLKPQLPDRAVVAHKPYAEWKQMAEKDFVFSLYPNDLIKVVHKRGIKMTCSFKGSSLPDTVEGKEFMLYYVGANISSGAIKCITNDNSYSIGSLGIKTLAHIEKYSVDILGEYHPVRKEKRLAFHLKRG